MQEKYDAIVLFSGGLDSLLAAKLLQEQGLKVLCAHFYSPFFGNRAKCSWWERIYGLDVEAFDASLPFVRMFAHYPPHGTGSVLNPCVDCKICLLRLAKEILEKYEARFLATGEVLGQRPMSQRADTLNLILRDSGCRDLLLRPLSAQLLPPTPMEEAGLVDRSRLLRLNGRSRDGQLELAQRMGLPEIPTPGGGCLLTERETARRHWPLVKPHWLGLAAESPDYLSRTFWLANEGRALFRRDTGLLLCIGRNSRDNERIWGLKTPQDAVLKLPVPGPLALARGGATWRGEDLAEAAQILASYAPKVRDSATTLVKIINGPLSEVQVRPARLEALWTLPPWEECHEEIKACRKEKLAEEERRKARWRQKNESASRTD